MSFLSVRPSATNIDLAWVRERDTFVFELRTNA
jgi:hypothetical protein